MAYTVVPATTDRALGSRPSRRLRNEGKLPGVVYGLGKDPVNVTVDYIELRDALKTDAGLNTVIELDLDGAGPEQVIVREVQRDPIKRWVTHADFMRIDPEVPVTVSVPIKLVGDSSAVTNAGGLIEQKVFTIAIRCVPTAIPDHLEADLSMMRLDRRIAVSDLRYPEGVQPAVNGEISVVTPVVSRAARVASRTAGADEVEAEVDE